MKKISLILSLLIALILIATYSYATVDATILSRASKTTVQPGDEIDVSLYLSNLEFTNKGVDEVEVKIDIDENILEPLTVDSIVASNGTMTIKNNTLKVEDVESASSDEVVFSSLTSDCDYKIFIDLKNPITDKETKLFTLKCKIKDDVNLEDVDIDIDNAMTFSADIATQVTAQDLKNGMTADMAYKIDDSLGLTIVKKNSNPTDENNTNNNANKNNSNTNKNNNVNTNNNTNRNNNTNTNRNNNNTNTNNNVNTNRNTNTNISRNNSANTKNNKNKNIISNNVNSTQANATTAKTSLPAAGIKVFIVPAIFIVGVAVFSYKKYMKYKDIK